MNVKIGEKEAILPDFLIVGSGRSGTTSLWMYLKGHPDVFMPDVKEPQFFALRGGEITEFYKRPVPFPLFFELEKYIGLFKDAARGRILGEASTFYLLYARKAIMNIKDVYGEKARELRIIMILRNPVERAFSEYLMLREREEEELDFKGALEKIDERLAEGRGPEFDYITPGMYFERVKEYTDGFPHVKVFLYEDLRDDPRGLLGEALEFIGAGRDFEPENIRRKYNVSLLLKDFPRRLLYAVSVKYNPLRPVFSALFSSGQKERISEFIRPFFFKKPVMEEALRNRLKETYREDILKLEKLIGRDLSEWLK